MTYAIAAGTMRHNSSQRARLMFYLDKTLNALAPNIPAELVSARALAEISRTGRIIPDAATSFFVFEIRLRDQSAGADFALCAAPGRQRDLLAGPCARAPGWQGVKAFVAQWGDPESVLHQQVRNLWLEFDTAGHSLDDPLPAPNAFVETAGLEGGTRAYARVLDSAASAFCEISMAPRVRDRVRACFDALPAGGEAFQIGFLLARPSQAVRLCVRGLDLPSMPAYLKHIAWEGRFDRLGGLLPELLGLGAHVALALDVGDRVHPKIGIECNFGQHRQFSKPKPWDALLEWLVARGWCRREKRDALLTWHSAEIAKFPHLLWPVLVLRLISHVKIVIDPNGDIEAKAYLSITKRSASDGVAAAGRGEECARD